MSLSSNIKNVYICGPWRFCVSIVLEILCIDLLFCPNGIFAILRCIYIFTCLLDLTSWSFLCCTVSKVEEDVDEGVESEMEGSEKKPFLGKEKIGEEGNPGFEEELTEEVKLLTLILILSP